MFSTNCIKRKCRENVTIGQLIILLKLLMNILKILKGTKVAEDLRLRIPGIQYTFEDLMCA